MRVLSFSYCFPTDVCPTRGVFVAQRLAALGKLADVEVAAPIPTFPLISRLRGGLSPLQGEWRGLRVHRPRFFYFPGTLKLLDGRLYARGLRRWVEGICGRWRPDVLDAHFVWPDGVGVSLLARQLGMPYVITLRGQIYPCVEDRRREQCVTALRGAAAVISVSDPMADIARELGVPDERIHVIPNGVDIQAFRPRDKTSARRELGLDEDGRLIVTVAHLGPRKGSRETIRAMTELPSDVRLILVGEDGRGCRNTHAIHALATQLGLDDHVIVAGRQPYEKVPLYFNAADVSVLASYREGCPNVVLESLASGTPVVASDVGAVPDLLSSPVAGRVVPPQQVGPLSEALADVLRTPPAPDDVARVSAVKSWDDVAEATHEVLSKALQGEST